MSLLLFFPPHVTKKQVQKEQPFDSTYVVLKPSLVFLCIIIVIMRLLPIFIVKRFFKAIFWSENSRYIRSHISHFLENKLQLIFSCKKSFLDLFLIRFIFNACLIFIMTIKQNETGKYKP